MTIFMLCAFCHNKKFRSKKYFGKRVSFLKDYSDCSVKKEWISGWPEKKQEDQLEDLLIIQLRED